MLAALCHHAERCQDAGQEGKGERNTVPLYCACGKIPRLLYGGVQC